MTETTEPTIEQLQNQVLELQKQNEENAAKIHDLEGQNTKLNDDLNNSRSLNAKLMRNLPAGEDNKKEEEEHEETQEEFFDSFINPAIEKINKR